MDDLNCAWFVLIGAIIIIALIFYRSDLKRKRIVRTQTDYERSLLILKQDPTNADHRQQTLLLGREYARAAREGGKETIFDEMALMNDINAVGGGTVSSSQAPDASSADLEERLRVLEDLKSKNLISDEEYEKRRNSILDNI